MRYIATGHSLGIEQRMHCETLADAIAVAKSFAAQFDAVAVITTDYDVDYDNGYAVVFDGLTDAERETVEEALL